MPRVYTAIFEAVDVSATQDLFEITPATNKPIKILGYELDNVGGSADAGDAQEEFLRLSIVRGHATSGSGGGTSPTPVPEDRGSVAAGFTVEINNTVIASAGTPVIPWVGGFNVRMPGPVFFTPETCPTADASNTTIVLRLGTAPADAVKLSGTIWIEET